MKDQVFTLKLRRYVSPRERDVPALRCWKDSTMPSKKAQKSSPSCTLLQMHSRLLAQHYSCWKRLRVRGKRSFRSLMVREGPHKTGTRASKAAQDGSAEGPVSAFPFKETPSLPLMR